VLLSFVQEDTIGPKQGMSDCRGLGRVVDAVLKNKRCIDQADEPDDVFPGINQEGLHPEKPLAGDRKSENKQLRPQEMVFVHRKMHGAYRSDDMIIDILQLRQLVRDCLDDSAPTCQGLSDSISVDRSGLISGQLW
jgi:hypothetical protein